MASRRISGLLRLLLLVQIGFLMCATFAGLTKTSPDAPTVLVEDSMDVDDDNDEDPSSSSSSTSTTTTRSAAQEETKKIATGMPERTALEWIEPDSTTGFDPRYQFNVSLSESLPIDRDIPETRPAACLDPTLFSAYSDEVASTLPVTDVIIVQVNELTSILQRTVASVLNRSPAHLLGQVIIVDDGSSAPVSEAVAKLSPKVRVIRSEERLGLMNARLLGIDHSDAETFTVLDSHVEVSNGWLEPLLVRIKEDPKVIVAPYPNTISPKDFVVRGTGRGQRGTFDIHLKFTWDVVNAVHDDTSKVSTVPYKTPAHPGGLFSMNRAWFEQLGRYDTGMRIWGYENIELSLRAWMCGGSLEMVPCSAVAHVYRTVAPRRPGEPTQRETTDAIARNKKRVALVWLDQHAIDAVDGVDLDAARAVAGNLSERRELRERLQCHSFDWYIQNVHPKLKCTPHKLQDCFYVDEDTDELRAGRTNRSEAVASLTVERAEA